MPSADCTLFLFQELGVELGLYLLSHDRAGYGESDPNPKRSVKSEALDIQELADQLEIGPRFYVIGISMEAYAAWRCLKHIPHSFAEPEGEIEGGYVGLESQSLLGEEEDPAETAALAGEVGVDLELQEGKDQKIRTPTSLESAAGAMLSGRGWLQQLVSTSVDTTKKLDEEITSVTDDEDGQIPAHHSSGRNDSKQTKTQGV
ncbi:hypothetical protein AAC387_Pa05g2819 [Persea americana]